MSYHDPSRKSGSVLTARPTWSVARSRCSLSSLGPHNAVSPARPSRIASCSWRNALRLRPGALGPVEWSHVESCGVTPTWLSLPKHWIEGSAAQRELPRIQYIDEGCSKLVSSDDSANAKNAFNPSPLPLIPSSV